MSDPALLPHENSYRVPGTRIIAGEYPGAYPARSEPARSKVCRHLDTGIAHFVDLTQPEDNLDPYEEVLHEEATARGVAVRYLRLGVPDNHIPTPERMNEILDALDAAEAVGDTSYLHCWGGVGRTGTAVGCLLVRRGMPANEALAEVDRLFRTMSHAKVKRHASTGSPQVPRQYAFVRSWARHDRVLAAAAAPRTANAHATTHDRARGALVGLATGDALGTTLEFKTPGSFTPIRDMVGGGPFRLAPGQWTDDTSLALCLAESLVECNGFDPRDQMERYVRWRRDGHLSSTGECFDIGNTTSAALSRFTRTGDPLAGDTAASAAGNGSLMRLAPVAIWFAGDAERAITLCGESSRTTHGAATAVDACRYFGGLLVGALRGESKETLLAPAYSPVPGLWERAPLAPEVRAVAEGSFPRKQPPAIRGTGYVVQSLEAALWAFASTDDFRAGCLAAANLGDDADTTAAIFGQIGGAFYGESGIPPEWRRRLALWSTIDALAEALWRGAAARTA